MYCPDVQLGTPYVAFWLLEDANGSPVTSGVTATASLYFLGFGATTAAVSGPTALTQGEPGQWGVTFPGSVLATPGYYEVRTSTIVYSGTTLQAQRFGFTVGIIPPEYKTVRSILTRVVQDLGLGVLSTTTASGSTTTLKDTRWYDAGLVANELVGDEVLFLEPGAASDPNPVRVTGSDHSTGSTGTLTLTPAVTSTVLGQDYLLLRAGKTRVRYQQIRGAIDAAIAALAERQPVTDQLTLTTTLYVREYAVPNTWQSVTKLEIRRELSSIEDAWEEVVETYWQWRPERQTVYLNASFTSGYPLRLTGTVSAPEARDLTSLVKLPWTQVRDTAAGYLGLTDAQRAGLLVQRGQRLSYSR